MPAVAQVAPGIDFTWKDSPAIHLLILALIISSGLAAISAAVSLRARHRSPIAFSSIFAYTNNKGMERDRQEQSGKIPHHQQRLYQRLPTHYNRMGEDPQTIGPYDDDSTGADMSAGVRKSLPVSNRDLVCEQPGPTDAGIVRSEPEDFPGTAQSAGRPSSASVSAPRFIMARPPPPPPLTPPEPSSAIFNLDDRRRSHAETALELDTSFFNQPNPDYSSFTSYSAPAMTQTAAATAAQSPATPRRRSYTKTVPIGVPKSESFTSTTSAGADSSLLSSSFPPTSPLLPGPPPGQESSFTVESPQEIELQGEIISVMDDTGAGWKRHTRVYGGGVCLACAASGSQGHHGGFYGGNVRPEEKR